MRTDRVKSKFLVHASLEFINLNEGQFTSILDTIVRCYPHYLTSYSFPKNEDTVYDITLDVSADHDSEAAEVRKTLTQLARAYSTTLISSDIHVRYYPQYKGFKKLDYKGKTTMPFNDYYTKENICSTDTVAKIVDKDSKDKFAMVKNMDGDTFCISYPFMFYSDYEGTNKLVIMSHADGMPILRRVTEK